MKHIIIARPGVDAEAFVQTLNEMTTKTIRIDAVPETMDELNEYDAFLIQDPYLIHDLGMLIKTTQQSCYLHYQKDTRDPIPDGESFQKLEATLEAIENKVRIPDGIPLPDNILTYSIAHGNTKEVFELIGYKIMRQILVFAQVSLIVIQAANEEVIEPDNEDINRIPCTIGGKKSLATLDQITFGLLKNPKRLGNMILKLCESPTGLCFMAE